MENNNQKYYPQLDAIRGISFLAVFIYHTLIPIKGITFFSKLLYSLYENLAMSIDVFFVLSSFLLTYLGLNEFKKKGQFSFKNYFFRRALRIWPLYYLIMFFSFIVLKYISQKFNLQLSLPVASWYLFFVANYYSEPHVFFLMVLWTLSVEEQFYLIWGICLRYFQKYLIQVITIFFCISFLFAFYTAYNKLPQYNHTLFYLIDMMVGAFAAISIVRENKLYQLVSKITVGRETIFYLFLPFLLFCHFILKSNTNLIYNSVLEEMIRQLFLFYTGLVIMHQMIYRASFFSLQKTKFLIYTGKISFGLYCFHGFVITFFSELLHKLDYNINVFFKILLMLAITFLVASFSYYLLEKPFLKLKEKVR